MKMKIDNSALEERWFKEKTKSVEELVSFIKKAPSVLKKYKFEKIQSEIISKLLKSNDKFWYDIEEGTENSRKMRVVVKDIEERVAFITKEIIEERGKESPFQEKINMLLDDLEYIKENYNPETKTLVKYEDVNKNYDDIELIFFFVQYAEAIDKLIENTMDKEGLFDKETLFVEYFAKLFAFNINGVGIEFRDNQIVLKPVVADDEDIAAVEELNNN